METATEFAILTSAISIFKTPLITIVKVMFINKKIKNIELRKALNTLTAIVLGAIISAILNAFGNYMPTYDAILIGTGVSYAAGQVSYRAQKASNLIKKL